MSIADFVVDKMAPYVAGGMNAETAARFTRGELLAIYRRQHRSRDNSGAWQTTPPPENIATPAAMKKCDEAIAEILNYCAEEHAKAETHGKAPEAAPTAKRTQYGAEKREGLAALEYFAGKGIAVIGAYESGAMIGKQEPENFTADIAEITALMGGKGNRQGKSKGTPIKRFYFIPADHGLLCLDIDRKPGKPDGLKELYKLFSKDTLPRALQDIENYFPCYVKTPSGGYHLYFMYSGGPVRKTNLCPEVEIKHGRPGLTAPGSRKENGGYVLYGNTEDAPPLYGIIIDRIAELQKPASPESHAPDRPPTSPRRAAPDKPRITMDALAQEAAAAYSGNHDRQVCFAGKACRCKFAAADTVSYAKSNPAIFGSGADTENTIKSVFADNGGM